ncbi:MAG TPA: E3 binding domain-containing protein [Solirubrobacterales bacterium]|nr:E3 binding domain-containing protein [Solirubrobacterales bacterium]
MASQQTKSSRISKTAGRTSKDVKAPQRGQRKGQRASEKSGKYRFAQNVAEAGTAAEREYEAYALSDIEDPRGDPDVLLAVPVVKVDSIHLELDNLDARVALRAQVLDLVKLNAGVDAHLGKLQIDIKGVEAQALLKVRLDRVAAIVDRVLTTIDRNPELVKSLGRTIEDVGRGSGKALGKTGEAVEDVGEGAGGAVQDVGSGAGQAVGEIGEGANQAVGQIGEGAGQAVGDIGHGAGQAVGDVGEGAGQAVGNVGETVEGLGQAAGQAGQGAGEAVSGVAEGAGGAVGEVEQAAAGVLGGNGGGDASDASAGGIAKLAAKMVVQELKSAATGEAKELGLAAARKAKEVGERRKERKAEEANATEAAMRTAEELDVDLDDVDGTGPEGRITIRDVRQAQEA